jgi:hypothetical protein
MTPQSPARAYYRATNGSWIGKFNFGVVDWRAFWACPMGLLARIQVISLVVLSKVLGRPTIATRVDYAEQDAPNEVRHWLRLSKWGLSLYRTREVLFLEENGRDLTISGSERAWPAVWRERDLGKCPGQIDETGTRASYTLKIFGTSLQIATHCAGEVTTLTMKTEWGFGEQVIARPR